MPDGLTTFIAERLNEAETAAKAAASKRKPPWRAEIHAGGLAGSVTSSAEGATPAQHDRSHVADAINGAVAEHIAANDPARVLRAISAKRAILAEHPVTGHGGHLMCDRCVNPYDPAGDELHRWVRYPCPTVRHLGSEWDDHPDYQPEWSPEPAPAP